MKYSTDSKNEKNVENRVSRGYRLPYRGTRVDTKIGWNDNYEITEGDGRNIR